MQKVRVVIFGYGHLGRWHVQKACDLNDLCELVAIVEPFASAQEKIKIDYPNLRVVSQWSEIRDDFDAAVVVTPTSTHYQLVDELLKAHKHVFCEKPLCSTICQVQELAPLIGDKVLQVGHSERFHEVWSSLREKFQSIKTPFICNIRRVAPFKGRATDVDVVQDLMIHDIDLMLYLFGKKPSKIEAKALRIRTDNWDYCRALFHFADGSLITIDSGRNNSQEERSLEVVTDEGVTFVDLFKRQVALAPSGKTESGEFVETLDYPARDHLLEEHKNFYQSILANTKPLVGYKDGEAAVYFVSKVLEALEKNEAIEL